MEPRSISHRYRDPLSEIWSAAARKIGLRIERTEDAFAHSDGEGSLFIASDAHLDEDDCLAQMIFHELCHSLVEGPEAFYTPDWGLDNRHDEHHFREHATLKVQAVLAGRYGLREFLGPTTDFRSYYDGLGKDALAGASDESTVLAKQALQRSNTNPWWPHLGRALEATSAVARIAADWPAPSDRPVLYRLVKPGLDAHPSGLPGRHPQLPETCGDCTWRSPEGNCRQASVDVGAELRACERFEPPLDCQDCGACCRAAYHSVTITEGDVVAERHPELMVHRESYIEVRREDDHCAALRETEGRFGCTIYEDRPTCCREFENSGSNCVIARRRLGLSL